MQKHGVSSILCYSKVQGRGTGEQDRIVLLLWKDRRSSLHTSAQFYSGVMCEREKGEDEVEAMGRCFAHKTQGLFAPQSKKKNAKPLSDEQKRSLSSKALKAKIQQGNGILTLSSASLKVILVPVRFVLTSELKEKCEDYGLPQWVSVDDFVGALKSQQATTSLAVSVASDLDASVSDVVGAGRVSNSLPLHLPFSVLMRQEGVAEQLMALAGQFGVELTRVEIKSGEEENGEDGEETIEEEKKVEAVLKSPSMQYKCKRCRSLLFTDLDITKHPPKFGKQVFANKAMTEVTNGSCTSHFLDPHGPTHTFEHLKAGEAGGEAEGKLLCSGKGGKCGNRIGHYKWMGDQCSCGAWVVPSVKIAQSNVDFKMVGANALSPARIVRAAFVPTVVQKNS